MLVLGRRVKERIIIKTPEGELLEITVLDIGYGKVRIGLDAPAKYVIIREEILKDPLRLRFGDRIRHKETQQDATFDRYMRSSSEVRYPDQILSKEGHTWDLKFVVKAQENSDGPISA